MGPGRGIDVRMYANTRIYGSPTSTCEVNLAAYIYVIYSSVVWGNYIHTAVQHLHKQQLPPCHFPSCLKSNKHPTNMDEKPLQVAHRVESVRRQPAHTLVWCFPLGRISYQETAIINVQVLNPPDKTRLDR
jgi:hypothetical protein